MSDSPADRGPRDSWALLGLAGVLILAIFIPMKVYFVLFLVVVVPLAILLWVLMWFLQFKSFVDIVRGLFGSANQPRK